MQDFNKIFDRYIIRAGGLWRGDHARVRPEMLNEFAALLLMLGCKKRTKTLDYIYPYTEGRLTGMYAQIMYKSQAINQWVLRVEHFKDLIDQHDATESIPASTSDS